MKGWARTLGCKIGIWPLKYLGVNLGTTKKNLAIWDPIIQKFNNNPSGWPSSQLNIEGKIVLMTAYPFTGSIFSVFLIQYSPKSTPSEGIFSGKKTKCTSLAGNMYL